jgi:MFS superfamily sulfate permease-like transporter
VLLGRIPGTDHFASVIRHPTVHTTPGVLIFRPNAELLYFNVDNVRDHMVVLLERTEIPLRRIIVDLSFTTDLDLSTLRMLADFARRAQVSGVAVLLAHAHYRVRALLGQEKLGSLLGDLSRAYSIGELVDGLEFDLPDRAAARAQAAL